MDWRHVERFLGEYRTHAGASEVDSRLMQEYLHRQAGRYHELTRWTVSVRGRRRPLAELGDEDLGIVGWDPVHCINRAREPESETSIGILTNPVRSTQSGGDEAVGLDPAVIESARQFAAENEVSFALTLRRRRDPETGLLLIYPISRHSGPEHGRGSGQPLFSNVERDGETVIGIAVVFPYSTSPATVRFVVGSAGVAPA